MTWTRFLVTVVIAALAVFVLLWAMQRRLIYLPDRTEPVISAHLPEGQELRVEVEDGLELTVWWLPASRETVGTVVVFPGNAGNRAGRVALARALSAGGLGTVLVDYRGYGGNPGHPSEEALVHDAIAIVDHFVARPDVDAASLVYYGESLGAGVATATAAFRPPAALILRSPFSSLPDVAAVHYPWLPLGALLWDRYPNAETIATLSVPLLVVAGSEDRIVPPSQSRAVYDAASQPKQLVIIEGAGHNDFALLAGDRLLDEVARFVARHMGT